MSDTPRTDALDQGLYGYSDLARVLPKVIALCRDLELSQTATWNEAIEAAAQVCDNDAKRSRFRSVQAHVGTSKAQAYETDAVVAEQCAEAIRALKR